jgi:hypothetical protein
MGTAARARPSCHTSPPDEALSALRRRHAVATAFALRGPGGTSGTNDQAHGAVLPFENRGSSGREGLASESLRANRSIS